MRYRLTSDAAAIAPALRARGVHHHLDHHALDAARVVGRGISTPILNTSPLRPGQRPRPSEPCARTAAEAEPVVYIVAAALGEAAEACLLVPTRELARFKGAALDRVTFFSIAFLERSILGVLATYVTGDQGTALSTTRPRTAQTTSRLARSTVSTPPAASMPAGTSTSIRKLGRWPTRLPSTG